jgi:arylsulfatase A-like enzyme
MFHARKLLARMFAAGSPWNARAVGTALLVALLAGGGCGKSHRPAPAGRAPAPSHRAVGPATAAPTAPPSRPVTLGGQRTTLGRLTAAAQSANLVICVLDAARADRLGCYGYPRDTTPDIDRIARGSVIFTNHFAPSPSTKPSTASLFTGLYPDTHQIILNGELDPSAFTLAEGLRTAGWRTVLFSSNVNASPAVGLGRGFQEAFPDRSGRGRTSDITLPDDSAWTTPEGLASAFAQWLARKPSGRFFAYVHFLPPHLPYQAPDACTAAVTAKSAPVPETGRFEFPQTASPGVRASRYPPQQWADRYDANLRWGDWGVGEVVKALSASGELDNTLLIITSDHGEAFGEHGYTYHLYGVYDELLHIPLVLRLPGRRRLTGAVSALTQTVDLLPTLCDLYRIPHPHLQGSSLLPLLDGSKARVRDYVIAKSEESWPSYLVRDGQWSLILYRGGELRALYDLRHDPGQRHNVAASQPAGLARMTALLTSFGRTQTRSPAAFLSAAAAAAPEPAPRQHALSPKAREELKALGYVD